MNKVFLGGTCNDTTWRNRLIPKLKCDYFNPVVKDWTKDCVIIENCQKGICNIHLYVITKEMTGVYSIAEAVESAYSDSECIFVIIKDGFDEGQLKSLENTGELIQKHGGSWYEVSDDNFVDVISHIINDKCSFNNLLN